MKQLFSILFLTLCLNFLAQAPQKMSYQAIVRNSNNQLIQNSVVGIKVSILQNSTSGNIVYSEIHLPTTNNNGAFSIEIGTGNVVTGTFNTIDWKTGEYWLQTEVDPLGGTNYSITAVSQLLSVPYAFNSDYANISGNGVQSVNDNGDGTLTFNFENGSTYTTGQLSGLQGTAGNDGLSAYQIWLNEGHSGSESVFLDSIKGSTGQNGTNGQNGVSITNTYIENDSLKLNLSNGQVLNAGLLAGVSITNTVIQNDSLIVSLSNGQEINAGYLNCPGQNTNLASISTSNATNIGTTGASVTVMVTATGNELILAAGVCYSTSPNPTFLDKNMKIMFPNEINTPYTLSVGGMGNPNLIGGTVYYARSFVTNAKGTSYGNEITFTTLPPVPPCMVAGNYNCMINLHFYDDSQMLDYNNSFSSVLVVNNDLTISLNINDPSMPFECTNFTLNGYISCANNAFYLNFNNSTCAFDLTNWGWITENFTNFSGSNSNMMNDSNGSYQGSIEIIIQ